MLYMQTGLQSQPEATDFVLNFLATKESCPLFPTTLDSPSPHPRATGLHAFENLADAIHASGHSLILCGAREQPAWLMRQAEFEQDSRAQEHLRQRGRGPQSRQNDVR